MPSHLQPSFHTLTYVPLLVGISAAASSAMGILGTNNKLDWKEIALVNVLGVTMGTYFAITGNSIRYGLSRYWS